MHHVEALPRKLKPYPQSEFLALPREDETALSNVMLAILVSKLTGIKVTQERSMPRRLHASGQLGPWPLHNVKLSEIFIHPYTHSESREF